MLDLKAPWNIEKIANKKNRKHYQTDPDQIIYLISNPNIKCVSIKKIGDSTKYRAVILHRSMVANRVEVILTLVPYTDRAIIKYLYTFIISTLSFFSSFHAWLLYLLPSWDTVSLITSPSYRDTVHSRKVQLQRLKAKAI